MDESPDHEPTLTEWGMGVHLNHPITAQRGIRNSRPDRWELQTSPSILRRDGEEAFKTSRRARPVLTVKIRQPSHEFTFGVGISFIPYLLVLTPLV
jgi:hypothetical protein